MPNAIDALSGDTKTLAPRWASVRRRKSLNVNSFAAASTFCSALEKERGSAVSGAGGVAGSVDPAQAAPRRTVAASAAVNDRRDENMDAMLSGEKGCRGVRTA
jgi:hypothetical protein